MVKPEGVSRTRVIVADDEPLARRRIRAMLSAHADFEIVGECADGPETQSKLAALRPDVLILDIEMPEINGITVVRDLTNGRPIVVFITAYERYAVSAFSVQALDYILKPFDEERFNVTVGRIRDALASEWTRKEHSRLVSAARELGVPDLTRLAAGGTLSLGDIEVDLPARRVWRAKRQVILRRREFDVLVRLLATPGEVVTRDELLKDVWGYKSGVVSRTIDTHVCEVRRKLGHASGEPGHIETVARFGYRILKESEVR